MYYGWDPIPKSFCTQRFLDSRYKKFALEVVAEITYGNLKKKMS